MNLPYQLKFSIYKRGKTYWVKWYINGKARYKSTQMTNKELANEVAGQIIEIIFLSIFVFLNPINLSAQTPNNDSIKVVQFVGKQISINIGRIRDVEIGSYMGVYRRPIEKKQNKDLLIGILIVKEVYKDYSICDIVYKSTIREIQPLDPVAKVEVLMLHDLISFIVKQDNEINKNVKIVNEKITVPSSQKWFTKKKVVGLLAAGLVTSTIYYLTQRSKKSPNNRINVEPTEIPLIEINW